MSRDLTIRPPQREVLLYDSALTEPCRVLVIQADASILGKIIFVMRIEWLRPREDPKKRQMCENVLVLDTPNARRCLGHIVRLRQMSTPKSCIYVVQEIIPKQNP